jgi:glycosyltransferase involved in cell wall biosynthesis
MSSGTSPLRGRHLVVCNWRDSAHPQAGGAELYCEEVARRLSLLGARVTLVTSRSPATAAREEVDFGTVVRLGGPFGTYGRALVWLLAHRRDIDGVIDSENGIPYFSPLAVGKRTPVILLVHHVHQEQFGVYLPAAGALVGRWLEKWVARWVYGHRPVCVVSPSTRAEVRRQLAFRGPVFIAPNGLTISYAAEEVERSRSPRIVCVGRLVSHKRVELLIDAIKAIASGWPNLEVHVVGDGDARRDLEKRVAKLGLQTVVVFHGRLSQIERDRLVSSSWLTVNASAGEGWGLSIVEAAALGIPAVAFRVPGMQDSVRPGFTGWLCTDKSELPQAIEEALTELQSPTRAAEWAARCRRWASVFSWDSTTERILDVLISEDERLSRGHSDRRRHSDAVTVADIPQEFVTQRVVARLRRTDQVRIGRNIVQLLFGSSDEHDTIDALDRLGIPAEVAQTIRPARHGDLVGWVEETLDQLSMASERSAAAISDPQ